MFEKSSYVLTIQKRNQYIEIQDGSYLVGFGMVWLFGVIKWFDPTKSRHFVRILEPLENKTKF